MKTNTASPAPAPGQRFIQILVGVALVVSLFVATRAMGASDDARSLPQRYAGWAGSQENAEALVTGLRNGSSITITTTAPDRSVSVAGFTPRAPMASQEVANALSRARATLNRIGIQRPTAEQIQAALIGGEIALSDGASTVVSGAVPVAASPPSRAAAVIR